VKRAALLLLTLTLVGTSCRPGTTETASGDKPGKPGKPGTEIEGEWIVVSSEIEGKPAPEGTELYTKMTFSGEDATLEGNTQKHQLYFTLDMTKKPKQINLYSKQEKVVWKGIYQVEGNSLKLSYGQPNGDRPSRLDTSEGSKAILYVLKRKET
jgi:uncharacterized protein (TIGR03067 family)